MDKDTFLKLVLPLVQNYRASVDVLQQLARVDLLAIVGPTGVGKTTIMERSGIPYVVGDTIRPPRPHEIDGKDYHFRTDYDAIYQEITSGQYVQFVLFATGDFYGTRASSFPDSGPATMAIIASAIPTIRLLGFRSIRPVYVVPPSYAEWMRRISVHDANDMPARMKEAYESICMALTDSDYVYLMNDNLDHAVADFRAITDGTFSFERSTQTKLFAEQIKRELSANVVSP